MIKHASARTARLLKENRFPQPDYVYPGQIYYHKFESGVVFTAQRKEALSESMYFAPDGTDVLKELGRNARASYDEKHEMWDVTYNDGLSVSITCTQHSLVEAASAVWLIKIKQDRDC